MAVEVVVVTELMDMVDLLIEEPRERLGMLPSVMSLPVTVAVWCREV